MSKGKIFSIKQTRFEYSFPILGNPLNAPIVKNNKNTPVSFVLCFIKNFIENSQPFFYFLQNLLYFRFYL